LRSEKS